MRHDQNTSPQACPLRSIRTLLLLLVLCCSLLQLHKGDHQSSMGVAFGKVNTAMNKQPQAQDFCSSIRILKNEF